MRFLTLAALAFLVTLSSNAYSQTEPKEKEAPPPTAAAPGPQPQGEEAKASVYIYRYKQFVGAALEPSIYCDETQLARMDNGRYFVVKLDPGKHTFRSNDKQSGVELDLKAGEEYYLRVEIATGFWKGRGRLVLTQKEQGAYELKKLKPLDAGKVVDRSKVAVAEPPIK